MGIPRIWTRSPKETASWWKRQLDERPGQIANINRIIQNNKKVKEPKLPMIDTKMMIMGREA